MQDPIYKYYTRDGAMTIIGLGGGSLGVFRDALKKKTHGENWNGKKQEKKLITSFA